MKDADDDLHIAALRAAVAAEKLRNAQPSARYATTVSVDEAALPPAQRADLQTLRDAGLNFAIIPSTPAPPPKPARVLTAANVENLDARDPMRTLYNYQRACLYGAGPSSSTTPYRKSAPRDAGQASIQAHGAFRLRVNAWCPMNFELHAGAFLWKRPEQVNISPGRINRFMPHSDHRLID